MSTVQSGQAAPPGVYISIKPPDLRVVSGAEPTLGGLPGAEYYKLPLVAVVVLGPVFGGVFAMSLPFMVFLAFGNAVREYIGGFRTFRAQEIAPWGVYLGYNRLTLAHVTASGERIEGRAGTRYIRLPSLLVVLFSPLLGLLYIMVFPVLLAVALLTVFLHLLMRLVGRQPRGPAWPFTSATKADRDRGVS